MIDWCKIAIQLQIKPRHIFFKEGEIWWCSVGINVGVEIFGKNADFARPVIIFKKFNDNSFLGIPLTTQPKQGVWHVSFMHADKKQYANFSQIRTFDSGRLINKVGVLSDGNFQEMQNRFVKLYTPENTHPTAPSEKSDAGCGGESQKSASL